MRSMIIAHITLSSLVALTFTEAFQVRILSTCTNRKPENLFSTPKKGDNLFESVIRAEDDDFNADNGRGGVRLALESVVQLSGVVRHQPGTADVQLESLERYNKATPIVTPVERLPVRVICTGTGIEFYGDPGETLQAERVYAPMDAVKRAINAAASVAEEERLMINFCGGNDAQVLEVLDAVEKMVLSLDAPTATPIAFRSISHEMFPDGQSSVALIALRKSSEEAEGSDELNKALLDGQVYWSEGKFYTLLPSDLNPAEN